MTSERDVEAQSSAAGNTDPPELEISSHDIGNPRDHCLRACLSWVNLRVTVHTGQVLLHDLAGYGEPGRLLAIMGPSGAGKSTLLDTLAGRPPQNVIVTGEILVNGRKQRLSYGNAAYLAQEVVLLGTLTVYETLYYSVKVRFPDSTSEQETQKIVTDALLEVGLQDVANTPIGTWHIRGISGGEKRRVSIALALLTSPHLLFLDEPTSGLDSASAYHVVSTLKDLARDRERTILCSIHQPSSEVYELFDDLCLLADGQQIYFGPLPQALQFFSSNGFPCPPLRSASDHYLHCVNSNFDKVLHDLQTRGSSSSRTSRARLVEGNSPATKNGAKRLAQAYATSDIKKGVEEHIQRAMATEGAVLVEKGSNASFFKQSLYLMVRSFLNMHRDPGYFRLRIVLYLVLSICIGTIYHDIGHDYNSLQARSSIYAFLVGFMSFMAIGGFPSFIEDMKVFHSERLNGHYRVSSFVVGNSLSSIPFIFIISVVSTGITYPLVRFRSGFGHVLYFLLNLFACLLTSEAVMMAVSSLISNFLLGILLGAGITGIYILVSGFFRLPHDIPNPVWKYPLYYVAYNTYGFQGMLQNEVKGQMFEGRDPGDPPINGNDALKHFYQVQTSRSKWLNLAIIFLMAIGYRIVFLVFMIGREKVIPKLVAINKKTLVTALSRAKLAFPLRSPDRTRTVDY